MKTFATSLTAVLLLAFAALPAQAQRGLCDTMENVTIDQITAIPQSAIDALNALGPDASATDIHELLTNEFDNARRPDGAPFRCVRVTGVVLSDPRYSGLASWNSGANMPGRIHVYIRDTAAETEGPEGMTIQVVDGTLSGMSLPLRPGDVIEFEGFLEIFGGPPERNWQLTPLDGEAIEVLDFVSPDLEWLQPMTVSTATINPVVGDVGGEPVVQANWTLWNTLNSQYVRVEGVQITNSDQNEGTGRPNWAFASVGEDSRVASRDLSLRYRNDRAGTYPGPPAFFTRPADDPFIAPPVGAIANVQGFLAFGTFDAFNIGQPPRAKFFIAPITDDDLDLTTSPPVIAVEGLTEVPTGPFDVFAIVQQGGVAPITSITLHYEYSNGTSGEVAMQVAPGDNRFVGTIPAGNDEDGEFVTYHVHAEDAGGLENSSTPRYTRVLFGGITQIEHIQRTRGDIAGPSPFAGITTDMDIEGIIMTDPSIPTIVTIQDDPDVNPWTGVFIIRTEAIGAQLNKGDRVKISHATIHDGGAAPAFNMTRLGVSMDDIEVIATGQPLYPPVTGIPTGLLAQDNAVAESYEGMWMRFANVTITNPNPDAPSEFGEFAFSTDGTSANQFRARTGVATDASSALPPGHTMWDGGEVLEYIQGVMSFSFGNYKLLPETPEDIGQKISTEPDAGLQTVTLDGAYPNPVAGTARVSFSLAQSGHVRLDVYDVTGRRVAVLVDGELPAGAQEANLEAGALASGLYIVRLAADGEVRTTRLVVAR